MRTTNSYMGSGNLGADPKKIATTKAGGSVVKFKFAENVRALNEKSNSWETIRVNWIPVTAFGALGDRLLRYLKKGEKVQVAGTLQSFEYEGKLGEKEYGIEVIAESVTRVSHIGAAEGELVEGASQSFESTPQVNQ